MDKAELATVNGLMDEGVAAFRSMLEKGVSVEDATRLMVKELSDELVGIHPDRAAKLLTVAIRRLAEV